ncbi:MAG: hypothetical protein LBQ54_11800, partial [Planctomycetaceae bacterium]|nr:hypothetical protein [Planctomycetaceae bacterium]
MSLSGITQKLSEVFSEVFSSRRKTKQSGPMKYRKLTLDTLEERQLLSINTVMTSEQFINSSYNPTMTNSLVELEGYEFLNGGTYYETIWGNDSVAGDNQGDFVSVWAQNDYVTNPAYTLYHENYAEYDAGYRRAHPNFVGSKVPEPERYLTDTDGNLYNDWNIYARYFTDEVQRVEFPTQLTNDNLPNELGRLTLLYSPHEVQKLTLKTANVPFEYEAMYLGGYYTETTNFTENITGSFQIGGIDTDGNGQQDWVTVQYNEAEGPERMAENIRVALSSLGGKLSDVSVTATSANDFTITFGDSAKGENMPELQVR